MAACHLLLALAINTVAAVSLGELVPHNLNARSAFAGGGWALSSLSCPSNAPKCGGSWCCPSSQTCVHTPDGMSSNVCCPGDTACETALQATPFCADTDWSLWNQTNLAAGKGFFCCLAGQVGTNAGECVSSDTVVAATLSAALIASAPATALDSAVATSTPVGSSTTATGSSASTSGEPSQSTLAGTSSSGTQSNSPTSSQSTSSTSSASDGSVNKKSSGLSAGAAAGIGVGATVVVLALIAAVTFFVFRRRRSSHDGIPGAVPTNSHTPVVADDKKFPEISGKPVVVSPTHEVDGRGMAHEVSGQPDVRGVSGQPGVVHEMHG